VRAIWDATIFHKKCLDGHTLLTAIGALNVVSDFLIFLWPVKPLWQIKLPLSQRIHLISVFSLGVLTCIGGILKLIWGQQYFQSWDILCTFSTVRLSMATSQEQLLTQLVHRDCRQVLHCYLHRVQRRPHGCLPAVSAAAHGNAPAQVLWQSLPSKR